MNIAGIIVIMVLCALPAAAQTYTILPGYGVEETGIGVGDAIIDDVIDTYGMGYIADTAGASVIFRYDSLGLAFEYDSADEDRVIRKIFITTPFNGATESGFVIGQSSLAKAYTAGLIGSGAENDSSRISWSGNGIVFMALDFRGRDSTIPNTIIIQEAHQSRVDDSATGRLIQVTERESYTLNCLRELVDYPGIALSDALPMISSAGFNRDSISISEIDEDFPESKPALYPYISRSIVADFRVRYFLLVLDHQYRLALVTEGENIVSMAVRSGVDPFGMGSGRELWRVVADSTRMRMMRELYASVFDRDSSYNDPFLRDDVLEFGNGCGIGVMPPEYCSAMFTLVHRKKTATLRRWLRSECREAQAYGAMGLMMLNARGIAVQENDRAIIKTLIALNDPLISCDGCLAGVVLSMSDALSAERLKAFLDRYGPGR